MYFLDEESVMSNKTVATKTPLLFLLKFIKEVPNQVIEQTRAKLQPLIVVRRSSISE